MKTIPISEELQTNCDMLFLNFKDYIYREFANTFTGKDLDTFFASVIQIILLETFDKSNTLSIAKDYQQRIINDFRPYINNNFSPLFQAIGRFGLKNNIPEEMIIEYCNSYAINALSKIVSLNVANELKKHIGDFLDDFRQNENEKTLIAKWHLTNLVLMAFADGNISDNGKYTLRTMAQKHKIDLEDILSTYKERIKTSPKIIPKDTAQKLDYFNDLVMMMFADNKYSKRALEFCLIMGKAYGYSENDILQYVKLIENAINANKPVDIMQQIGQLMSKYL